MVGIKFAAIPALITSVILGAVLVGCAPASNDNPASTRQQISQGEVTLNAVTGLQPSNILVKSFLGNFRDKLNEKGTGLVRINYLGSQDIIPPRKVGAALKAGQIDLLHSPVSYYIGMVPEGYGMMAANQSPVVLRRNGGWEILQEVFANKAGARLIAWGEANTRFQIFLSTRPKLDLDGIPILSGMRMRATGTYRPFFKILGATTINIRSSDIVRAMRQGVIEGFGFPEIMMGPSNLYDGVKYRVVPGFYRNNTVVTMNLEKWRALPRRTRELIERTAINYEQDSADYIETQRLKDEMKIRAAGIEDIALTGKAAQKFLSIAHEALWEQLQTRSSYADRLRSRLYTP